MKQFRYVVNGQPVSTWFNYNEMPIQTAELEKDIINKHSKNWQMEFRTISLNKFLKEKRKYLYANS